MVAVAIFDAVNSNMIPLLRRLRWARAVGRTWGVAGAWCGAGSTGRRRAGSWTGTV